jgi:hypothetical protein
MYDFSNVVEVMMMMMMMMMTMTTMVKEEKEYVKNKSNPLFRSPLMLSKLVSSASRCLEVHTENKMKF